MRFAEKHRKFNSASLTTRLQDSFQSVFIRLRRTMYKISSGLYFCSGIIGSNFYDYNSDRFSIREDYFSFLRFTLLTISRWLLIQKGKTTKRVPKALSVDDDYVIAHMCITQSIICHRAVPPPPPTYFAILL